MTSQLRRAAVSVPANIAEGSKRRTNQDFARFLNISEGSISEADYLLLCSKDLGYVPEPALKPIAGKSTRSAGCSTGYARRSRRRREHQRRACGSEAVDCELRTGAPGQAWEVRR